MTRAAGLAAVAAVAPAVTAAEAAAARPRLDPTSQTLESCCEGVAGRARAGPMGTAHRAVAVVAVQMRRRAVGEVQAEAREGLAYFKVLGVCWAARVGWSWARLLCRLVQQRRWRRRHGWAARRAAAPVVAATAGDAAVLARTNCIGDGRGAVGFA